MLGISKCDCRPAAISGLGARLRRCYRPAIHTDGLWLRAGYLACRRLSGFLSPLAVAIPGAPGSRVGQRRSTPPVPAAEESQVLKNAGARSARLRRLPRERPPCRAQTSTDL